MNVSLKIAPWLFVGLKLRNVKPFGPAWKEYSVIFGMKTERNPH
jgi:hypothetical protein